MASARFVSAQHLVVSKVNTDLIMSSVFAASVCSTPCGI